jgi:hypothetical protein
MSKTILLQSFRNYDVPAWVIRCQESVKGYASQQNWKYKYSGDEFFNWAPSWAKEVAKTNMYALSDVCRLEWMKHALTDWDTVIWADIDILVIDPNRIVVSPIHPYGFSYELCFTSEGWRHGYNNAFMFFRRNSDMLNVYLERCYELLRKNNGIDIAKRTVIGPDLLRTLDVPESHIIQGLNILNYGDIIGIYKSPIKQVPSNIQAHSKSPIGAVNLCLNERSIFAGNDRVIYDQVLDVVSEALLKTASGSALFSNHSSALQQRHGNISRNQPCPCGSGKRYKHCHGSGTN